MNCTEVWTDDQLDALIKELTDYSRPICYRLSEILVVPVRARGFLGWRVYYQKDKLS